MQFKNLVVAALATAVSAGNNTVTFTSMDNTDRTIVWTPSGSDAIEDTSVPAGQNVSVSVPTGWVGNAYSYSQDAENKPGMLAEFAFDSWGGSHYFDVSAIVDPDDHNGVYQMYPADTQSPVSGCETFACDNAYYLPDDIQTKSTTTPHIIVTLGGGTIAAKKRAVEASHPREALINPDYRPTVRARDHPREALTNPSYKPAIKGRKLKTYEPVTESRRSISRKSTLRFARRN